MHAAIRPYATVGVALVGAGVIAVTPVTRPLPDIHIPTLRAEVALTQVADPITTLVQVVTTAVSNAQTLVQTQIANPAPGLVQFLFNQAAYANIVNAALTSAGQSIVTSLDPTNPSGVTQSLSTAFGQILSGDINDGINGTLSAIGLFAAIPLIDVLTGVGQVGTDMAMNLQALVPTVLETLPLFLALGVLGPVNSVISAFGFSAQQVLDSVTAGNLTDTVNALLDGPINIIGGFLNGFGPGIIGNNGGILTPQGGPVMGQFSLGGPIGFFQELQADIAADLATAVGPATSPAAASASPNLAASTVTVTTAAPVKAAATAATTATTATTTAPAVKSAPAAKPLTPSTATSVVTTGAATVSSVATANTTSSGNKVVPGQVGGKGTAAGVSSALSKVAAGLSAKTGTHK